MRIITPDGSPIADYLKRKYKEASAPATTSDKIPPTMTSIRKSRVKSRKKAEAIAKRRLGTEYVKSKHTKALWRWEAI